MKCPPTLSVTTGMCCHSGCCPELSKAMSKLLSLGCLSWSLAKCTSQTYSDSLWDKTRVVSSAPPLPVPWFPREGNWEYRSYGSCSVLHSELWLGWLALQLTEQPAHSLDLASVSGLKHSAPKYFEIIASSPDVCTACSMWCLRSSQGAIKSYGWTAVVLSWTDHKT